MEKQTNGTIKKIKRIELVIQFAKVGFAIYFIYLMHKLINLIENLCISLS